MTRPTGGAPVARPRSIGLLGWCLFAGSCVGASIYLGLGALEGVRARPEAELPFGSVASYLFFGFGALAGFSAFAALRFLRRRAWARAYFEVLGWTALAFLLVFAVVISSFVWARIGGVDPARWSAGAPPRALVLGLTSFMTALVVGLQATVPALLVWVLRSRFVRPWFDSRPAATPDPAPALVDSREAPARDKRIP